MAMQLGDRKQGDPMSEINTTPLIDVMLVLLIMLIITLPPQRHAVKLDTPVPCKTCEVGDDKPRPVTVAVDIDGSFRWNDEMVSRAELDRRLSTEARREEQPDELRVAPHRRANYGAVAHVMAAAQREGMKRLGIVGGT